MDVTDATPTKEITIKGLIFVVPAPYTEGHVLKANEASVLNQTLAENLRNNFATSVADAVEQAGGEDKVDLGSLQAALNDYVAEYEFGVRRAGSGAGAPKLEPRVRIARDLAKNKVKESIRKAGHKVSDFSAEKINALAMALIEKNDWFLSEADRQLKAQQKAAADTLEIDLGEPDAVTEGEGTTESAAA